MDESARRERLRDLSLNIEQDCGLDSIATIERMYDRTPKGAIICCFPDCVFATRDSEKMWWHVHTGPKHDHGGDILRWANFLRPLKPNRR